MKKSNTLTSSEGCPVCLSATQLKDPILCQCPDCGLIFLVKEKRESIKQIEMYDKDKKFEFWSLPKFYIKHKKYFDHYFSQRYQLIKSYHRAPLNILDIGCGYAFWGDFLKSKGEDYFGIDADEAVIAEALKRSLKVKCVALEDFKTSETYDCVSLCDVLEHSHDLRVMLKKSSQLLRPNGLIYIQVPSVFGFKIPYGHNPGLPFHFWHFTKKSLFRLLEEENFEILNFQTGVLGVIGRVEKQGRIYFWQRLLWHLGKVLKIGNRLQVLAKKRNNE